MAKVFPIGKPVNEAEIQAIAFLRDNLPDGWQIFHNFELRQGREVFEIDIAVVASHAVYLVDVKGVRGHVEVSGGKWYPDGRQHYHSPLAKVRTHARVLSTLLSDSNKGVSDMRKVHVQAMVLLTADDVTFSDRGGNEEDDVVGFRDCKKYFADKFKIPGYTDKPDIPDPLDKSRKYPSRIYDIRQYHGMIAKAIQGKARAISGPPVFGSWQVEDKLGGCERYKEYRAKHNVLGDKTVPVRLRVYKADPLLDEEARKEELKVISNAFIAVQYMSPHTNVLAVRDLIQSADGDEITLVTDDISGQVLRQHIQNPALALTADQKFEVIKGVLAALEHAHQHEVVHRNITPDAVLTTRGGIARLTDFDFARVGQNRSATATIAHQIEDDINPHYRAPELYATDQKSDPRSATAASDIFSVGVVFYELLTGELPFRNSEELFDTGGEFPEKPSALNLDLPDGCDEWLQKFCKLDPANRYPSAAIALQALEEMLQPKPDNDPTPDTGDTGDTVDAGAPTTGASTGTAASTGGTANTGATASTGTADNTGASTGPTSQAVQHKPADPMNLPKGFLLVDRFTVQERLGSGSFGVVYKVFDDLGNVERVIKLITKDRLSTYERLRREYTALTALDGHDNVVKVIWAGRLPDSTHTPYIAFEYVKGRDVSAMIESGELSSDDTFRIMCDAAMGLAYIHENGVYHQDIKPSNLVWTDHGVIIIDFNVAVTEGNEVQINSGTRRYLPPDFDYGATEPNPIVRADRDLYALGITLYECLTGLHPLDNPEPPPDAQTTELKQFQSREDLKAALEIVVAQMTAPERKDRYASADELLSTIDELKYLRSAPPAAKIVASPKPVASTTNASPTSAGNDAAAVATSTHDGNESDIGATITAGPDPQAEAIAQAAANNAIASSAPAGTETAAGIGPTTQANETAHPTTPHAGESTPAPHAGEAIPAPHGGETAHPTTPHPSTPLGGVAAHHTAPHAGETAHFTTPHAGEATTTPRAGETTATREAAATPHADKATATPHAGETVHPSTPHPSTPLGGVAADRGAPEAALTFQPTRPNTNPFVSHLLTLYSQSRVSNAGTRGLDGVGRATYVPTYLDEKLKPALFSGSLSLVVISGNAGDGKTAFIQQFEAEAARMGALFERSANGALFQLNGRTFQSNYDGSQDEGDEHNDSVLQKFFAPYTGDSSSGWPENQTRLIAVNEGRLVDFFLKHQNEFPLLEAQVEKGLKGAALKDGVAVINLNLRSVVAAPESGQPSILERLIARMTKQENWRACEQCDLKDKCYAYHNVRTFQDPIAGAKVVERLKTLYTITHLRGRLHITMRDIRSALAFMLAGTRDCDAIHELYASNNKREQNIILDGFYFNSWLGGSDGGEKSNDRLISLLKEIDIAEVSNPDLDRDLDFLNPKTRVMNRFTFAERATHDNELVEKLFSDLPRDYSVKNRYHLIKKHQDYLAHIRRRYFFERRDAAWKNMLPYTSIKSFQDAIEQTGTLNRDHTTTILHAINRGEGLSNPTRLGNQLALRVRQVNKGSIRSYRLFSGDHFTLRPELDQSAGSFLESLSQALVLHYDSGNGHTARLRINLDIYEMLMRLNNGYRPSVEEQEGFYLSLLVFKNVVSAAPYQEVLLTESGYDFYKVQRDPAGVLHMARVVEDTHEEDISEEVRA